MRKKLENEVRIPEIDAHELASVKYIDIALWRFHSLKIKIGKNPGLKINGSQTEIASIKTSWVHGTYFLIQRNRERFTHGRTRNALDVEMTLPSGFNGNIALILHDGDSTIDAGNAEFTLDARHAHVAISRANKPRILAHHSSKISLNGVSGAGIFIDCVDSEVTINSGTMSSPALHAIVKKDSSRARIDIQKAVTITGKPVIKKEGATAQINQYNAENKPVRINNGEELEVVKKERRKKAEPVEMIEEIGSIEWE